jgi:hypothetical protein
LVTGWIASCGACIATTSTGLNSDETQQVGSIVSALLLAVKDVDVTPFFAPLSRAVPRDTFYYKFFKTRKSTPQCMREHADWLANEENEEMFVFIIYVP